MCETAAFLAEQCCLNKGDMGSHGSLMSWGTLRYLPLLRIKVPPQAAAGETMSEGCGKKGLQWEPQIPSARPERTGGDILDLTPHAEHSRGLAGFSKGWDKEHSLQHLLE